jgi:5'-deoxynucleotidase YfbR-like HD superfamily hydrolase
MAALLEVLYPDAPVRLLKACLFHDVAERWTGDMPAPGKWWLNAEAGELLRLVEHRVKAQLQVDYDEGLKTPELHWLKALDLLELILFCSDEQDMGNRNVDQIADTCLQILQGEPWVPKPITQLLSQEWCRTDDTLGHHSGLCEAEQSTERRAYDVP